VLYNTDGTVAQRLTPFGTFTGGVTVATGDLDGDGVNDTVAGAGPGGGPRVIVLSGATGEVLADFFAYESTFTGGVWLAVGDVDGDGRDEIITGAGVGGGPRVRILRLDGSEVANFFTSDSSARLGVTVAAGDLDGDGAAEIVTGVNDRVLIFAGKTFSLTSEFDTGLPAPVSVALGNGFVLVGSGVGDTASARAFSPMGQLLESSQTFEDSFRGGTRVAISDLDADGESETVLGAGIGGGPRVQVLSVDGDVILDFFAFDSELRGGVFVG